MAGHRCGLGFRKCENQHKISMCLQGKFLIDGFPRSFDNMDGWDKVIGGGAFDKRCVDILCAD